ncbi:CHAT domain-containing protein [Streptomyces mayteni]
MTGNGGDQQQEPDGDAGADSGGLLGLRAWAASLIDRADAMLPGTGSRARIEELGPLLAQLTEVAELLGDEEPQRPRLDFRRGALLALRGLSPAAEPGDLAEAERILRGVRQWGLPGPDGARAALFLLVVLRDKPGAGAEIDQAALVDWALAGGAEHFTTRLRELGELAADVYPAMDELGFLGGPGTRAWSDELAPIAALIREGALSPDAEVADMLGRLPEDSPFRPLLETAMRMFGVDERAGAMAGEAAGEASSAGRADAADTAPTGSEEASPSERRRETALTVSMLGSMAPGSVAPETLRRQVDALDAQLAEHGRASAAPGEGMPPREVMLAALMSLQVKLTAALRDGDTGAMDDALKVLRDAMAALPADDELRHVLEPLVPALLDLGGQVGGNLRDQEAARRLLDATAARSDPTESPGPAAGLANAARLGIRAALASAEALRTGDPAVLRQVVAEVEATLAAPHDDLGIIDDALSLALGQLVLQLGNLTRDRSQLLAGVGLMEGAIERLSWQPSVRRWGQEVLLSLKAVRAEVEAAPEVLRQSLEEPSDPPRLPGDPPPSGEPAAGSWGAALGRTSLFALTKEPAELDRAIEELERLRTEIRDGRHPGLAPDGLWRLAEVYQSRWALAADLHSAVGAAMESLRHLAADVLLQSGPEHGLLTARRGAARAVATAGWAASNGWIDEAVAALELGRAMVLHAAAASDAVADLLSARGHTALAATWREHSAASAEGAEDEPPPDVTELPSSLRRRALEALGYRQDGGAEPSPFAAPGVSELAAGVAAADADALVYLIPSRGSDPGTALVIGADFPPGVLALPGLIRENAEPLWDYLDAAAARSGLPADARAADREATEQAWEKALGELCDWAWSAVMSPLLSGVAHRLAANPDRRRGRPGPPRLVLIPCGTLGVVPWHAARYSHGRGSCRHYVCQQAVISHAASGSQFLRTIARSPRPVTTAPALIADPRMDLVWAELEVTALHEACYPRAVVYGELCEPSGPVSGTGTPEEVLALLSPPRSGAPVPVSLLHVASHAAAGTRPTVSALRLASPAGGAGRPAEPDGAASDAGLLTVARLLEKRGTSTAPQDTGPLVVLSACETDLTTRDHDEALTLATAFVARGARDVVGSRWTTRDSASAVMMAVFHHHVAVEGLSPADALRAAQRWMLDPRRVPPPTLTEPLLGEATRPGLDRLSAWAAFIHQGHPGPLSAGRRG